MYIHVPNAEAFTPNVEETLRCAEMRGIPVGIRIMIENRSMNLISCVSVRVSPEVNRGFKFYGHMHVLLLPFRFSRLFVVKDFTSSFALLTWSTPKNLTTLAIIFIASAESLLWNALYT